MAMNLAKRIVVHILIASVITIIPSVLLGFYLSQYSPVFGGLLEKSVAVPFSPARQSLIAVHVLVFGAVGFVVSVVIGCMTAILSHPNN